ncbi:MAG: RelA/SpoT family protein [Candidatus Heteroscillospira sp.]|jgi:guanosine-3',5'-bis(diphosphate) 3'-pyrophosphohydrolase
MAISKTVPEMYQDLEKTVLKYNPNADMGRVHAAFDCAERAHSGQKRKDGSPYVTHAIAAAQIAAEMGLDEDSVVSALLHDCIEDTSLEYDDIARQFGTEVADIVDGVTKLTRVQYTSKEDEQMENMRKMLMAMSKDIRVILIKIADRLHNMRTMEYQTPEKQRSKSRETMQIYAPIAHRLGMQRVKWELEDLSLLYLDPVGYKEITDALESRRPELEKFMHGMEDKIKARLEENGIKSTVYSRIKHIYSIYRKMYTQHLDLSEIFDLCALRVIVDELGDCYNVLGYVHEMFNPVPGRFKDYVSTPKPNGYQSIHTTVIGTEGIPFEVQIRTWDMHHTAEYGVAAHWKYKSGSRGVRTGDEEKFAWVRRLLETQQESEAQDFFHDLKVDMFADEVFVFSPKGDVINLPAGATPIDFAYNIHSAVGNRMVGAKINGRIVPIGHVLQNGDIVDIITAKNSTGPSRDWLNIAKSGTARTKIKQWFKKEKREENIVTGRDMFESELKKNAISVSAVMDDELLPQIIKKLSFASMDDMYAAIGYGGITSTRVVNRIKDEMIRAHKPLHKTVLDKLNEQADRRQKKPQKAVHGILVEGLDNCLIKFSRCCTPIPGDEVVGFITRGNGVSVHCRDCTNFTNSTDSGSGRWISVSWADDTSGDKYSCTLHISSVQRNGLIMDVATVLNSLNAQVRSVNAKDLPAQGLSVASVTVEVKNTDEVRTIINRLNTIKGVVEVLRAGHQTGIQKLREAIHEEKENQ